ncbi:Pycsar system effector family protein [Saccharomonospora halophila]|uniref:Pycsar system effector family protein n=1 Tax=Saccharomonospora halophila TaxID=129922 RepID=UPI0038CD475B
MLNIYARTRQIVECVQLLRAKKRGSVGTSVLAAEDSSPKLPDRPIESQPAQDDTDLTDVSTLWEVLRLVNEWVKHAEVKTGATLASTGVAGGSLFNLVKDNSTPTVALTIAASVCALCTLLAASCAMTSLYPRVRLRRNEPSGNSLIFFSDIARNYPKAGDQGRFDADIARTVTQKDEFRWQLSQQIRANAIVADRKFRWTNRAIRFFLLQLVVLFLVAALTVLGV